MTFTLVLSTSDIEVKSKCEGHLVMILESVMHLINCNHDPGDI